MRGLAHDRFAGAGLAGEGDPVDERVLGQEFAGRVRPEAMDDVVDALGHAGLVHHFAEQGRGQRGLLGGLDDDRVAAGKRRADFPCHQQERQVPGRNDGDDALGLPEAVVEGVLPSGVGRMNVSVETPFTVSANILKLAAPRGMSRWRARLEGLPVSRHSAARNSSKPRVDAVGDFREQIGALGDRHPAPRARERGLGGAQAASISARPPSGTRPMTLLSSGVRFSQNFPVEPSVNAPSMKWAASRRARIEASRRLPQSLNRHRHILSITARVSHHLAMPTCRERAPSREREGPSAVWRFRDRVTTRPTGMLR